MLFLGDLVFYYKGLKHKRHMVHNFFGSLAPLAVLEISDGSGMEKVGFGRVRVCPISQLSDIGKFGFEYFQVNTYRISSNKGCPLMPSNRSLSSRFKKELKVAL